MIPRLKPFLDKQEILALLSPAGETTSGFEDRFAKKFNGKHAIAFPHGRSALWAFFKALGIEGAEIIQPAYTCVVVSHATVLSQNIPRFVDINLTDYNMNLDALENALSPDTRCVILTHLFGYPADIDKASDIIHAAEDRFGHKIWIIQDCAHSFGSEWKRQPVHNSGDLALFGLGISKTITSIFGGMLLMNDTILAEQIRAWRDALYTPSGWGKAILRRLYMAGIMTAFYEPFYTFVYWLQEDTSILDPLTKAYHLDEKIHFPPDYLTQMANIEATIGSLQLEKYDLVIAKRRQFAEYYASHLPRIKGWIMPPLVDGATYSHYVIRVPNRKQVLERAAKMGVQFGQLIEYSIPHMPAYAQFSQGEDFPNSLDCSHHTINLPIHAGLKPNDLDKVVQTVNHFME